MHLATIRHCPCRVEDDTQNDTVVDSGVSWHRVVGHSEWTRGCPDIGPEVDLQREGHTSHRPVWYVAFVSHGLYS